MAIGHRAPALLGPRRQGLANGFLDAYDQIATCFVQDSICESDMSASLVYLSIDTTGDHLLLVLEDVENPESNFYRGEVPDELVPLIDSTIGTLRALVPAMDDFLAADCTIAGFGSRVCDRLNTDVQILAGDVASELDRWQPYM